jgi:KDO2-lipid IV(A) lauroyltransferase
MYYIVYGFLYVLSLLPLPILYLISDFFYLLIYYVIGYRKNVVMTNLMIAFPHETEAKKRSIAKKFYKNFIDTLIEAIKMMSVNDEFILKRFTGNFQMVNDYYKTGKSCHLLVGHTFNWEWGNHAASLQFQYKFLGVYMPIANKVLDRIFYKLRSRAKTVLLSAHNMKTDMMEHRNSQYALGLAADQNPGGPDRAYWLNFFGQPAPFVTGPEKNARAENLIVFFCNIRKQGRGYYNLELTLATENAGELQPGELTTKFVRYLENNITEQPDMWLWTHKRWKHRWKDEYAHLWVDKTEVKIGSETVPQY